MSSLTTTEASSSSDAKMTTSIKDALEEMTSWLKCQICDQRFNEPATLSSCNHTFCHSCITNHTDNKYTCPGKYKNCLYGILSVQFNLMHVVYYHCTINISQFVKHR